MLNNIVLKDIATGGVVDMLSTIYREMQDAGYQVRSVSIEHLDDLRNEMTQTVAEHHLPPEVCEYLSGFKYDTTEILPDAKFLLIVAIPSPIVRLHFTWNGAKVPVLVPPTYGDIQVGVERVKRLLEGIPLPKKFRFESVRLPGKLLAVRSGMGSYGRNNICYLPQLGSFVFLAAFYSDLPCSEDHWVEAGMMTACANCQACLKNCPTGVISTDRFLIKAERCITCHNEKDSTADFPDWIDPMAHNCLNGCLRCQMVCPQNKDYLTNVLDLDDFNEEETMMLLEGQPFEDLPSALITKLKRANVHVYYSGLSRNLRVLLNKWEQTVS